jgi:hypothetical protein
MVLQGPNGRIYVVGSSNSPNITLGGKVAVTTASDPSDPSYQPGDVMVAELNTDLSAIIV